MSTRSTETTVTFQKPFKLKAFDERQPAGTYRLLIDEEEILGVSFLAFRRTATMLLTPALSAGAGVSRSYLVDSAELAAALEADGGPPERAV